MPNAFVGKIDEVTDDTSTTVGLNYEVRYKTDAGITDLSYLTTIINVGDGGAVIRDKMVADIKTEGSNLGITLTNSQCVVPEFIRGQ